VINDSPSTSRRDSAQPRPTSATHRNRNGRVLKNSMSCGCPNPPETTTMTDSPDLVAAMRLLDAAKNRGFAFVRRAPGEDGPLLGVRETSEWCDVITIGGFGDSCSAQRLVRTSLVVPGGPPVDRQVSGDALTVLHTVVCDWVP
jgi:hypothetical protein